MYPKIERCSGSSKRLSRMARRKVCFVSRLFTRAGVLITSHQTLLRTKRSASISRTSRKNSSSRSTVISPRLSPRTCTPSCSSPLRFHPDLLPTLHSESTPDIFNRLPPLRPFSTTAFLTSLKSHGHPLLFRAKTPFGSGGSQAFYEAFLKSPNFGVWLARRCGEAIRECEKRAKVGGWTENGSGVGSEGGGGKGGGGLGLETGMETLAVGGAFNENDSRRSSSSNGLRAGKSSESSAVS
jgi:hypothetical protein